MISLDGPIDPGRKPGAGPRRGHYVAIAGDIAVAGAKFLVAAVTGSPAMLTEGVHSPVDTGNPFPTVIGDVHE